MWPSKLWLTVISLPYKELQRIFRNFTMTCHALIEMTEISVTVLEWLNSQKQRIVRSPTTSQVSCHIAQLYSLQSIMTSSFSIFPVITQFGRKTKPEFILQETSQVKGRFAFVWGKNKNKRSMFQNSFLCCKDTKGCLSPTLTFFSCWRIPKSMKLFLYKGS